MVFCPIDEMIQLVREFDYVPIVLITTRSAPANIESWKQNRTSAAHSYERALTQYHYSYLHVFRAIDTLKVPYCFLSLEALCYEGMDYFNAILSLIGISQKVHDFPVKPSTNIKRYRKFNGYKKFNVDISENLQ